MAKYYVVKERNSGSGCLVGLILGIIIVVLLLIFAMSVISIIIGVVLLISGIVGTVITIKNYFVALVDAIRSYSHYPKPRNWVIPTFLYRWVKINWETTKNSWRSNFENVKNFFNKMCTHHFFSVGLWFWLFSALSILVFGSIASIAIFFFHLYVFTVIVRILLIFLAVASVIFGAIGLVMSLIRSFANYFVSIRDSRRRVAMPLPSYILKRGYREYFNVIKGYWLENMDCIKDGFRIFSMRPFMSFKKWLNLFGSIMLMIVGTVLLPVFAIVHIIVLSFMFLFFLITSSIGRR